MRRRVFARGGGRKRREAGEMNNTESAYAAILELRKLAGDILDYGYERVTLKLGPNLRLTCDFDVHLPDGEMQLHEVKSNRKGKPHIEDDAWVKLKVLVDLFNVRTFVVWPTDKTKERWHSKEVGA